jgi:hypothetical protein
MKTENQKNFVVWTKKNFPKLYQAAILDMQKGEMGGFADFFTGITDSITNLAPSYLQFRQQKSLMKMQLKRAKAGLPPANVSDYTPVIKTRVDLAPDTRTALVGGVKDMLMPLAIGGGILLVILAMKKKRR